jgi:hypothetical protein
MSDDETLWAFATVTLVLFVFSLRRVIRDERQFRDNDE